MICSSVAQAALYPLLPVWYCGRLNGANLRKSRCKALCAVLRHVRLSCIYDAKRTANACMWLQQGKIKALHPQQMQGKRKAPPAWAGWIVARELNFVLVKKCLHFVIVVFCQLVIPLIIRYMISSCRKVFFLVACKIKILIAF